MSGRILVSEAVSRVRHITRAGLFALLVCHAQASFADRVDNACRAVTDDPSWRVRLQAALTLGKLKDKRAVEPLTRALGDENETVRGIAAQVLGTLGGFDARPWLGEIDVPTAVVVTARDHAIATGRQRAMAAAIPGATVHDAPGGHASVVFDVQRWRPVFLAAVAEVVERVSCRP